MRLQTKQKEQTQKRVHKLTVPKGHIKADVVAYRFQNYKSKQSLIDIQLWYKIIYIELEPKNHGLRCQ